MKKVFLINKDSFTKQWVCEGTWSTIKFAQKASMETLEYTESFTQNYFESTFYQENYLRNLARAANVYEIFRTYYPEQLIAIVD